MTARLWAIDKDEQFFYVLDGIQVDAVPVVDATEDIKVPELNMIVQINTALLQSNSFYKVLWRDSFGGNAGKHHACVNAYYQKRDGQLETFTNQSLKGSYGHVGFRYNSKKKLIDGVVESTWVPFYWLEREPPLSETVLHNILGGVYYANLQRREKELRKS